MSRFSRNIPAVRQFKASTVSDPSSFDREKAMQLLRDGMSLINSFYPAGALEWLRENRPDVMRHLKDDRRAINQAIQDEDYAAVVAVVETSIKHHRQAFAIYEARPPVIEVQGDLLAA